MCKLFCLGYIRTFLYSFISMIEQNDYKFLDHKLIIKAINGDDNQINPLLNKMIKLYTYKIIFNKINRDSELFTSPENIKFYHLDEYSDFYSTFMKIKGEKSINFELISIKNKDEYEKLNKLFDKYKL